MARCACGEIEANCRCASPCSVMPHNSGVQSMGPGVAFAIAGGFVALLVMGIVLGVFLK